MPETDRLSPGPSFPFAGLLRVLLAVFCAGFAFLSAGYAGLKLLRTDFSLVFWGLFLFFGLAAALSGLLFRLLQKTPAFAAGVCLFALALLVRVLFHLLARCAPVSDFANYLQMAVSLRSGDPGGVAAVVEHYQLPEFAGLAVLNCLLSFVFSPTLAGLQWASMVLAACIAAAVYCLGCRISKPWGLLAGLFYAWYPASILSSQVLTNQHGATLFALLSVLLLLRSLQAKNWLPALLFALAAGALLTVSHFFHPSSLPTRLAVVCFFAALLLRGLRARKNLLRPLCCLVCFLLGFQLFYGAGLAGLRETKLIPPRQPPTTMLSKIVVGLNPETSGSYSLEDYTQISSLPPEERDAYCKKVILERLQKPAVLAKTLAVKTFNMWVRTDNLFVAYDEGVRAGADSGAPRGGFALDLARQLQLFDALFLALLYLGGALGLLFAPRRGEDMPLSLMVWIVLGWLGTHVFSEVQPRYRYFAMPFLAILSAGGWLWLSDLRARRRAARGPFPGK